MVLRILGTSSGQPTLDRNLACLALEREGELFLFDCGEGAQIQFRRAGLRFGRLQGIFITHMHGDHVTGLPGMLMSLQMTGRERPLRIVGPPGVREFVLAVSRLVQTGYAFPLDFHEIEEEGPVVETDAYTVRAAPLEHRIPAWGYRFEERAGPGTFDVEEAERLGVPPGPLFGRLQRGEAIALDGGDVVQPEQVLGPPRRGKSMAYCSDTRPCDAAVALARKVDLLVHESTFMQDRLQDAIDTGHSTAEEAATIALRAEASRLVLTHFSPRYSDASALVAEARRIFERVEAAQELGEYPLQG